MRLQLEAGQVVFRVETGDTVDSVARLVDLLSGPQCTERVTDNDTAYAIHIQAGDDRLPFAIDVPKDAESDDTLLALCAAYLCQQESPDRPTALSDRL